jgi:hypothetical protein
MMYNFFNWFFIYENDETKVIILYNDLLDFCED